jgi:methionine-rich copper-binding protein CopC
MKFVRLLSVLWSVSLLAVYTAVTHAHAELLTAVPAPGSTIRNPVGEIRLTFQEPITADSTIILFTEDFQPLTGIAAEVEEGRVLVTAVPTLSHGSYTVQWTAVSVDGHSTSGSYAFQVTTSLYSPLPVWEIGLSLLFVGIFVILWRRSRNR